MENLTIEQLQKATGKSQRSIYILAKKLNRLPTVKELLAVKRGRPKKY